MRIAMIFLLIHIAVCIAVGYLYKTKKLKTRNPVLLVVICIPVWGIGMLLVEETAERRHAMGRRPVRMYETIERNDLNYRTIQKGTQEDIVPLEEAMTVNDTSVSRRLMLEILHKNPDEYIDLLKKATSSDDVELTHYATTTMLEIQSRYEWRIEQSLERLEEQPENLNTLRRTKNLLEKYLESGLISGAIAGQYRKRLLEVLETLQRLQPQTHRYVYESLENRILAGSLKGVEKELQKLLEQFPQDENVYRLSAQYYYIQKDGQKLRELFRLMEQRQVYLDNESRKWYDFWTQKG